MKSVEKLRPFRTALDLESTCQSVWVEADTEIASTKLVASLCVW